MIDNIENLPMWIECHRKDNKRKRLFKSTSKDVDYYTLVIIKNIKHEEVYYTSGYYRVTNRHVQIDKPLLWCEGQTISEAIENTIKEYNKHIEYIENETITTSIWKGNAPNDK